MELHANLYCDRAFSHIIRAWISEIAATQSRSQTPLLDHQGHAPSSAALAIQDEYARGEITLDQFIEKNLTPIHASIDALW